MMKKVFPFLIIAIVSFFIVTCKKFVEPKVYVEPTEPEPEYIPEVVIVEISDITTSSVKISCNVTYDGGVTIIDRGVCWGTEHNPTFGTAHLSAGIGVGSYTLELTDLQFATTYYITAYAINSYGTGYSEETEILMLPNLPDVRTISVSNITYYTAQCGGTIPDDGGGTILAKGVCWSKGSAPTIANYHTVDGEGTDAFTSSLTDLSPNTDYYVRAYATNENGTSYGNQKAFTTPHGLATVTTRVPFSIQTNSAKSGGYITYEGGAPITAKGVCWSKSSSPTLSNYYTVDGEGTGTFTSELAELKENTTYYVRAYATNSFGTAYGNTQTFKTKPILPVVQTGTAANITANSVTVSGSVVTEAGTTNVTARGVCYSQTTAAPTLADNHTTNGAGVGSFDSVILGLSSNTTYYIRAYATNSAGTAYGTKITVKTQ